MWQRCKGANASSQRCIDVEYVELRKKWPINDGFYRFHSSVGSDITFSMVIMKVDLYSKMNPAAILCNDSPKGSYLRRHAQLHSCNHGVELYWKVNIQWSKTTFAYFFRDWACPGMLQDTAPHCLCLVKAFNINAEKRASFMYRNWNSFYSDKSQPPCNIKKRVSVG